MIFSRTIDLVLSGRKRCTTRLQHAGDFKTTLKDGFKVAVLRPEYRGRSRARWIVGNTYAVQFERCHHSRGRIKITRIEHVADPVNVSLEVAQAEGFDTVEAYQKVWHELHKTNPIQPCWRLWFTLVSRRVPQ